MLALVAVTDGQSRHLLGDPGDAGPVPGRGELEAGIRVVVFLVRAVGDRSRLRDVRQLLDAAGDGLRGVLSGPVPRAPHSGQAGASLAMQRTLLESGRDFILE